MPSEWKSIAKKQTEEEKRNALALLRERPYDVMKKAEPSDLPGWVKAAFVEVDIGGKTYRQASELFKRNPSTLGSYARCPGAKKWREALRRLLDDPALMAKAVLESAVADSAANLIWAIEAAKMVGDYKEVRVGSAALLDRLNIQKKDKEAPKPTIHIHIGSVEPEIITVKAEVIEEDDDGSE